MAATVTAQHVTGSRTSVIAGRIIMALVTTFLLFDAVLHFTTIEPVVEAFTRLGYPLNLAVTLGVIEIVCVALYVIPRTAVLGAILLTGYLGGAVATHVRVGSSLFGEVLFPVYVGVFIWGALFLLDTRVRTLIPLRG